MDPRAVFEDRSIFVRLRPEGFEFRGVVQERFEATGLDAPTPVRKLFQGGRLACYAPDGEVSRSGRACTGCPDRSACQPRLQVRGLTPEGHLFILELPPRAGVRFLDFVRQLEADGRRLGELGVVFHARRTVGYPEIDFSVLGDDAAVAS